MRLEKFRFLSAIALFAVVWLTVRFPIEVQTAVGHFFGENHIDPATLHLNGEFVENNLGSAQESDSSVTVRMIAQQYVFVPQCVLVPAGVPVHFRITSADVAHELTVAGSTDVLKALPGTVNTANFEFPIAGEFSMPCHEFCGSGHYAMRAKLVVVPREQFQRLQPDERISCEPR
jgi:cytochrome c oxidase subunit 2